jgi:hypothetical protein
MPYPSHIVVYLKAPVGGARAKMNALAFGPSNTKSEEDDLTVRSPQLRSLNDTEEICFVMKASGGIAMVESLMVKWTGGCRATLVCLLGEKGPGLANETGVDYDDQGELPCDDLYCRFNGLGILTCEDRKGTTVTIDVGKPGPDALCLAFRPKSGSAATAAVVFPQRELPDVMVRIP